MFPTTLFQQLDSANGARRLLALQTLRNLESLDALDVSVAAGPSLPSYDHVHTAVSYGRELSGIHSVARMIWAAHETNAYSASFVEHESLLHCDEAVQSAAIVNQDAIHPLRLALGVEFKAPLAMTDGAARRFGELMARQWGQGEAAWVVGMGLQRPTPQLRQLVTRFQAVKRRRTEEQLARLNRYFALNPPLSVSDVATPEGNTTDRAICFHVARAACAGEDAAWGKRIAEVRKLLNPGQPCYVPYSADFPCFQEVTGALLQWGMTPTFTAQLRGDAIAEATPLLKAWGIRGLDLAGIEPNEPGVDDVIRQYIDLAIQYGLDLFGGSDYRGDGTGWNRHAAWMDSPLIRKTLDKTACRVAGDAEVRQPVALCRS